MTSIIEVYRRELWREAASEEEQARVAEIDGIAARLEQRRAELSRERRGIINRCGARARWQREHPRGEPC